MHRKIWLRSISLMKTLSKIYRIKVPEVRVMPIWFPEQVHMTLLYGEMYILALLSKQLWLMAHILPKFAINYVSETEHGSFVIKNGNNVITPGSEVAQYTMLTVEATPAEGYQVKSIKVNDTEIEGNTFIVNGESTVSVEFTDKLTINYTVSGVGTFTVIDENDPENPFNSGDEFEKNTSITMVLAAGEGYEISSFIVNGEEQKESIMLPEYIQ